MKINKFLFNRYFPVLLLVLAVLILLPGFLNNAWKTAGKKWFVDWRMVKDAPIIGRLVISREEGIFSYAGLMGWGDSALFQTDWEMVLHQYETYENERNFILDNYKTYNSALDFQGIFLSIVDRNLEIPSKNKLFLYQFVAAFLSSFCFGLITVWNYQELGIISAIFSLIFIAISEWITLFGGSLYWSLWSLFIPFIWLAFYLKKNFDNQRLFNLFIVSYFSLLIKCLFTGFEFITTSLIMVFVPLLYYEIKNGFYFLRGIKHFAVIVFAQMASVGTALLILFYQNVVVLGGAQKAFNYIKFSLEKRSIGEASAFVDDPALVESLNSSTISVLREYLFGRAVRLNLTELSPRFELLPINKLEISYDKLFLFFLCSSILYGLMCWKMRNGDLKLTSIIITTWVSSLAPLSWFIIFKAHSYLHMHLDFIIWQMPFTILGFAMCGAIMEQAISWIIFPILFSVRKT